MEYRVAIGRNTFLFRALRHLPPRYDDGTPDPIVHPWPYGAERVVMLITYANRKGVPYALHLTRSSAGKQVARYQP